MENKSLKISPGREEKRDVKRKKSDISMTSLILVETLRLAC